MTEEKTYTKVCIECGFEFETKSKRVKLCEDCRKQKSAEHSKEQTEQSKKPKAKTKNESKGIPLIEYTAIVERYNKEHGTSYTYGKFEELVRTGKIKL